MTEILLIRHGETDWNAAHRLQGHLDIDLNAAGVRQIAALGAALRGEALDAIFSSDMRRALQTAQAIAATRELTVQIEPGLRERCYGAFEGLRHSEIRARYPEAFVALQARDLDARFPEGARIAETLREFSARSIAVMTRLIGSGHRKIAVVTHGGFLDCVNRAARGLGLSQPRDFDIPNAGINRLRWDGVKLHICQWGDVAHLSSALDEPIR